LSKLPKINEDDFFIVNKKQKENFILNKTYNTKRETIKTEINKNDFFKGKKIIDYK
jgi:hypothetical protein